MSIKDRFGKYLSFTKLSPDEKKVRRSRSEIRRNNNLGIIAIQNNAHGQVYRSMELESLDRYYDSTQYNGLEPWDSTSKLPRRQRKPRIVYGFARNLASRVGAKIVGESVFPKFMIADSPDDQDFIRAVIEESKLRAYLIEPIRRAINTGSVFIRFKIVAGSYQISWYHAKFCYPTFQENDELESVEIKYIYDDHTEKDINGNPVKRWYKLVLGVDTETLFDNPIYDEQAKEEPEFQIVESVAHGMGFVQGEWVTTSENQEETDGYGLVTDIRDFIDELCYSMSSSSRAVDYNQDPQLTFKGVDEDAVSELIKNSTKSWNLGREGSAEYLESRLDGVNTAIKLRETVTQNISDLSRATILNPDKMVAAAQSARAMEVLNGPLVELIDELRSSFDIHFRNLVLKLALATLIAKSQGIDVPIMMPDGYVPKDLTIKLRWPPIYPMTFDDLLKKVSIASNAATANIISRKTALRYIAEDFDVEDIDAEVAEISAQPIFNPFGGF